MKKQTMSLAVASALLVGGSGAFGQMYINERGTGETLVYPFFSAANGNDTYIHVVNTTDLVKAVKVRFLEAQNSVEILDFNLYLSPRDHWSAAITEVSEGNGGIVTVDTSCTVPALGQPNNGFDGTTVEENGFTVRTQPFVDFEYNPADAPENVGIERTLQGYVEIIEMGQLDAQSSSDLVNNDFFDDFDAWLEDTDNDKAFAATHDSSGVPNGCEKLVNAWGIAPSGAWTASAGASELLSTWTGGGLYGYGTLINVEDGTAAGYDAVAIDDFTDDTIAAGENHEQPGSVEPNFGDGVPAITIFDDGGATTFVMDDSFDAVSGLFMHNTISNDFVVDANIRARTDWVITQPTKRFYVNGVIPENPYTDTWDGLRACETVDVTFWDREELFFEIVAGPGFSPAPPSVDPDEFQLCTEVSIVGFGTDSAVRSRDDIFYGFNGFLNGVTSGWAEMSLTGDPDHFLDTDDGNTFFGLPTVGFAVISYRNDDANAVVPGVLAAYSATTGHKTSIDVQAAAPAPTP